MMKYLLVLATALFSSAAFANDTLHELPLLVNAGNCPSKVNVGVRGESIVQGLRYTVDVKSFLAPGSVLELFDAEDDAFAFTASTLREFQECDAFVDLQIWSGAKIRVSFRSGTVSVWVQNKSSSFRIDQATVYNNQAIIDVSEAL